MDDDFKVFCAAWIYKYTAPHQFIELLYGIGFFGIKNKDGWHFGELVFDPQSPHRLMLRYHTS